MPEKVKSPDHRIELPDGRFLGYREYGDREGLPVLYFHGTLSCRLDIEFADENCRRKGIRLIAPDRPDPRRGKGWIVEVMAERNV